MQIGKSRVEVAGDQVAGQQRLAGPHPVAVALDGVDLAVVGDAAGTGGPAASDGKVLVEKRECTSGQRGGEPLVGQVGEERLELAGGEHALVDEGARGQRREVDVGLVLGALAQAERQPVERHARRRGRPAAATNSWRKTRHAPRAPCADAASGVDRDVAPAEDRAGPPRRRSPRCAACGLGALAGRRRAGRRCRRRRRPPAGSVEVDDRAQERVGDLDQDAGAVAGVGLGAGGAAVLEVAQRGQAWSTMSWPALAGQRGDEGDAAGVVLVLAAVQALCRRAGRRSGRRVTSHHRPWRSSAAETTGHGKVSAWTALATCSDRISPDPGVLPSEPRYPTSWDVWCC